MKAETKAKIQMRAGKIWRKVKEALPGILFWGGASVVTYGALKSYDNTRDIRRLNQQDSDLAREVVMMRDRQDADQQRMLELERQQNLLFERALRNTEGVDQ
ncbi:MAG: hypothetical protein J6T99_07735 [Oscillospiraceae bacterium]|nr:hypothetical protein [Oscillospiraceae bacterium]